MNQYIVDARCQQHVHVGSDGGAVFIRALGEPSVVKKNDDPETLRGRRLQLLPS